jgi:hypothetical protein
MVLVLRNGKSIIREGDVYLSKKNGCMQVMRNSFMSMSDDDNDDDDDEEYDGSDSNKTDSEEDTDMDDRTETDVEQESRVNNIYDKRKPRRIRNNNEAIRPNTRSRHSIHPYNNHHPHDSTGKRDRRDQRCKSFREKVCTRLPELRRELDPIGDDIAIRGGTLVSVCELIRSRENREEWVLRPEVRNNDIKTKEFVPLKKYEYQYYPIEHSQGPLLEVVGSRTRSKSDGDPRSLSPPRICK